MPRPPLPHVPGCDVAGVVDAVGRAVSATWRRATRWWSTRRCRRSRRSWRTASTRPWAPGFEIVGEHRWGGHGELVVVPGPQRRAPARRAARGRSAPPTRSPRSPPGGCSAGPGADRRRVRARRRHRRRGEHRRPGPGRAAWGRSCTPRPATRPSGERAVDLGRGRRVRLRRPTGRCRSTSWSRASAPPPGTARCGRCARGAAWWCAAARRAQRSSSTCPACSSSRSRSSARPWARTRSSPT